MRKVQVGRQQGDEMIIAKGIAPGDTVVTDGQLRLTPNARVIDAAAARAAAGEGRGRRGEGGPAAPGSAPDGRAR